MKRVLLGDAPLVDGEVRIIPYAGGSAPHRSFLLVQSREGLRVYWNVCQHLPIPLDAATFALPSGEELVCLTHGARYRKTDGHCVDGPCAGSNLERVPFEVEDGRVFALIES